MAVTTGLLRVAEFARLPQPPGGIRQELHHGELVEMAPAKWQHTKIQKRLVRLAEAAIDGAEFDADKEFPFRPLPEHEVWIADVAVFSLAVGNRTGDHEYYSGVPAIVIEVLSPSNTASEMLDREQMCLADGGQEFWLVDPERKTVKVTRADGHSQVYRGSDSIASDLLGAPIGVDDIFAQ